MTSAREAVRSRRRQRRRRKAVATGAAAAVIIAGAGTAWAMNGSDGPRYRLATVRTGSVSQTVDTEGSLAAARVADASFPVAGTVATVDVGVGEHVIAGQRLATMDPSSLEAAVAAAKNDVASAEATVADAEDGTVTSAVAAAANGSSSGSGGSGGSGTARATTSAATTGASDYDTRIVLAAAIRPASAADGLEQQSAKVKKAADALVDALNGHIDSIAAACTATTATTTSTIAAAADADGKITGSTGTDTTTVTANGRTGDVDADGSWRLTGLTAGVSYTVTITAQHAVVDAAKCSAALDDAKSRSSDVAGAVTAFDTAVDALGKAAQSRGSTSAPTTQPTKQPKTQPTSQTPSTSRSGSGSAGASGASGPSGASGASRASGTASTDVTVTSEMLASYTAAVTTARARLAVARSALADAALTAPVTGTIASVGLSKGATVTAGSSTADVQVVADGTLSMSLSIPLSKIALVKAGQTVQVTVDSGAAVPAKVTYVGTLNSAGASGGSATYTVLVQLDRTVAGLRDGMGASAAIDVGTAADALVVPLSAVHAAGARRTVEVYSSGTVVSTPVTVGVSGSDRAQISAGLRSGQQVVIADLNAATPTSGSSTTTRGGFGRFPGSGTGGYGGRQRSGR